MVDAEQNFDVLYARQQEHYLAVQGQDVHVQPAHVIVVGLNTVHTHIASHVHADTYAHTHTHTHTHTLLLLLCTATLSGHAAPRSGRKRQEERREEREIAKSTIFGMGLQVHTHTHTHPKYHVPCIRPSQEKHANLQMHWMCIHRFSPTHTHAHQPKPSAMHHVNTACLRQASELALRVLK